MTQALAQLPTTALTGVGPKMAEKLAKCQILNVQDILFHLPMRYLDRTHVTALRDVRPDDYVVVEGIITESTIRPGRKASLLVKITDHDYPLTLRFFHFNAAQKNYLSEGARIRCFGEAKRGFQGLEMIHPEYRIMRIDQTLPVEETLTPIYPSTEGLNQKSLRNLTDQALNLLEKEGTLAELLPESLLQSLNFPTLKSAILLIHRPPPDVNLQLLAEGGHPAQKRLAFEELLAHRLSLRQIRQTARQKQAPAFQSDGKLRTEFLQSLPFKPTQAQVRVSEEILADVKNPQPMLRLVQGDVGSGKTLVAALAMLEACANGYQAALMAPTDILAQQHYLNFKDWLAPFNLPITWLAGKHKGKNRKEKLEALKNGESRLAIGTHALFQAQVDFADLGLIVVDEQHRFGVHQRLALREKGSQNGQYPHQLIMTATPIPRTLSMTAYADLDVSIIDELPPGRTPVKTVVLPDQKREAVIERIQVQCALKKQVYWVCPLIEESEVLQCQAAEKTYELLCETLKPLRIGLIHGRMKPKEKEALMAQFKAHELDLLVATTVIEVGVDVPNASLMIIENAERLGLSQLHQLRGRVGRGSAESFCVLLYQSPLSNTARSRLNTMRESNDGFVIAEKDLELRGPGEVLGTRQTGMMQFRIADLQRDQGMLSQVQVVADEMLNIHPQHAEKIIHRWIGEYSKYSVV